MKNRRALGCERSDAERRGRGRRRSERQLKRWR